jgi:hypothetical protein
MIFKEKRPLESSTTVRLWDSLRNVSGSYSFSVGQTPRKLFSTAHPERFNHGLSTLPIGNLHGVEEDPHLLTQNERCFRGMVIRQAVAMR